MPSPAQYAANRLNAVENGSARPYPRSIDSQRSAPGRGPATPQGKARSSMNALRHGLTARVVVLPTEDMAAYKKFSAEIVDSLDGQTPVERQFAQTVADNQWRINRIRSIEDGMLGLGHFEDAGDFDAPNPEIHSVMTAAKAFRAHSQAFVNLSICEQRLHRAMKEALRQLKELQAERRERAKTEMDNAIPAEPVAPNPESDEGVVVNPPVCNAADRDEHAPENRIGFVYATSESPLPNSLDDEIPTDTAASEDADLYARLREKAAA